MSAFTDTATAAAREAATHAWTAKTTLRRTTMSQHEDHDDDRDRQGHAQSIHRPVPPPPRRRQLRRDAAIQAAWLAGLR